MEVDVAVRHQQSRAERPDQVGFGADLLPDRFEVGVADDFAGALLVRGGDLHQFIHCAVNVGVNIRSS